MARLLIPYEPVELDVVLSVLGTEKRNLYTHDDADGISSAVLFIKAVPELVKHLYFPERFGSAKEECGVFMLDMSPIHPCEEMVVIDHHPKSIQNRNKFKGFVSFTPTSGIVWSLLKELIPRAEWWKALVGIVGDGQAEQSVAEMWSNSYLFKEVVRMSWDGKTYRYPLYLSLSSGLNAISRTGNPLLAYQILRDAESPLELVFSEEVKEAKARKNREVSRVLKEIELLNSSLFVVAGFESEFKINGEIAFRLSEKLNKTVFAVNLKRGEISGRGVFAHILGRGLETAEIDGHSGYVGGILKASLTEFFEELCEKERRFISSGF